jgi:hypothetical protein
MPRWLLAVLVVSVLMLLAVAAKPILFPAGNPRLTRETFDRIREGMSRGDVEAILGPPGDYRTGPTACEFMISSNYLKAAGLWWPSPVWSEQEWDGDEAEITVFFDTEDRVVRRHMFPMKPESVGLLGLLRWRWNHCRESWR